jgi:hypothetical protein
MKRRFPCHFNDDGLLVAGCYEAKTYGVHHCTCDNAPHKQCDKMLERLDRIEELVKEIQRQIKGKDEA